MTVAATRSAPEHLMTEAEFEAWCDEDTRAEFVDGKVILMSPVSAIHDDLFHFIARLIGMYLEYRPSGRVRGPEFEIRLREGLRRVPDLLFVCQERTQLLRSTYVEGAPDAAWEIVSPDSVERDWRDKHHDYEAAGVREYWIVDPHHQQVRLLRLVEGRYQPVAEDAGRLLSETIPGFWLKPEWLWQEPLPRTMDCLREMGVA